MDSPNHQAENEWERNGLHLKRHFARSTANLRRQALAGQGYDPARLYKWGEMMALAVIRLLEAAEKAFGAEGQKALSTALVKLGRDLGREILEGYSLEPGTSEIQAVSAFVTYINEEIWASLEIPQIIDDRSCLCDILWCPHQDHYKAFDCRVQRYLVQGLLEAWEERTGIPVDARFTQIIPKGAETCRFEIRRVERDSPREWSRYSETLAQRALDRLEG